ncbi:mRNA guanylyltransferase [Plasmodium inui San Antonio 1]|uniref:mRNA guanylyltransferase n=1 Tax=Plasmodium inui San Antonio 1 TaxID=1237626 RepID=W7AKW6_9APIC|nr:mRNA guanylyltransferase [Plasmodium inui San Antonio 1]EUD65981.1 mRNA guanylyltransferase [Plasmodium inui San Antonio 1]
MITDIYHPGEKIENEFVKEKIRSKINDMLKWKRKGFPGSNPVSLTKNNIRNLFSKDYLICEKTDGVRYFLFIASNTTFLIDRNYDIFKNDIHIPTHDDLHAKQQLTLLDGELVQDTIFNKKKGVEENKIVYLIYDGLFIHRKDVTSLNYLERLTNVYNFVIVPLKKYRRWTKQRKRSSGPTPPSRSAFESDDGNVNHWRSINGSRDDSKNVSANGSKNGSTNEGKNVSADGSRNVSANISDTGSLRGRVNQMGDKDNSTDQWSDHNDTHPVARSATPSGFEEHSMDRKEAHINSQHDGTPIDGQLCDESDETIPSDEGSLPEEENLPFEIYLKDFYSISQIKELIQTIKKLPHPSDGIIFTPLNYPYRTGNFFELLKWKPLNLNTVDFGIETIYDQQNFPEKFELFISIRGVRTSYRTYLAEYGDVYKELLTLALNNKISHYIIECYYVAKHIFSIFKNENGMEEKIEGGWIAQKIRFDKNIPNDISTLNKVIQSILDNITIDSLIKEISRNRRGKR